MLTARPSVVVQVIKRDIPVLKIPYPLMSDQPNFKGDSFVNLNKDQYEALALKIAVLRVVI